MQFSTKSTYGLRAIANLAKQKADKPVSLASIAKTEGISRKYLEAIFAKLRKARLIKSSQGARGGYSLAVDASEITVFDVIKSLEKDMRVFYCVEPEGKRYCRQSCDCPVSYVLSHVQGNLTTTLKNIKLNDLIK